MGLTQLAIKRPVAITMLILALLVMGFLGLTRMPAEESPRVEFGVITVFTTYPGAGPAEVETLITKVIEDAVGSVGGIRTIDSVSQQGVSTVTVQFYQGTDMDIAATDVREKVDGIKRLLPDDVEAPSISKLNTSSTPILYMAMRSTKGRSLKDLRDLADNTVKDRLAQVPDVASVFVTGGDVREILVAANKSRLDAYGLSLSDVSDAIRAGNQNLPAGRVTEINREYAVRVIGEYVNAKEIENQYLNFAGRGGAADRVIQVKDIATVTDTVAERTEAAGLTGRVEGQKILADSTDTVSIVLQKTTEGNTVKAAEGAKRAIEKIAPRDPRTGARVAGVLPADIEFTVTQDSSVDTEDSLRDVEVSLAIGAMLAVLIVYVFLHNLKGTFIVALAIPTSIIATFLVMWALGFTLNSQTLLGLSLATGILVDDSIVVLENIYRHLQMGETPQEAAINGRQEIGLAAVIITMVDVVVFLPVAFMGGVVGQFFRSFGITVAVATLFSLLMSFTLAPMLASRWYAKGEQIEGHGAFARTMNRFYDWLDERYRRALRWALQHRGTVVFLGNFALVLVVLWLMGAGKGLFGNMGLALGVSAVLLIGSILIAGISYLIGVLVERRGRRRRPFSTEPILVAGIAAGLTVGMLMLSGAFGKGLGFRFAPGQDQSQVAMTVELPAGASLAATQRVIQEIEASVRDLPEIKYIETQAGASAAGGFRGGGRTGTQFGQVRLTLIEKLNKLDQVQFWKDKSDLRTRTDVDVAVDVRKRIKNIVGAKITVAEVSGFGGSAAPVQVQVEGADLDKLVADSRKILAEISKHPGTLTPDISYKASKPEIQIRLDRERAAQYGVTLQQVAAALRDSIEGNTQAKFREAGEQYDIRVQYALADRNSTAEIGNVIVSARGGVPVRVADVCTVIEGRGPTQIDRKDRLRKVTVSAYLKPGYVIGNVQQDIDPKLQTIDFGTNSYRWGGEAETLAEEGPYMVNALLLAVVLVYMLMAALFNNPVYPFIIMLTIPQALVGGLVGLMITNTPLSIIAMIGVIMLMGLVTKNAILLVDFTNTLRTRGYRRNDALIEAGPTRLRPILMTTLAQILGTLPIALALGRGSEFRQPLGIVVIGGLVVSSLLTLLVIPCTYTFFDDMSNWFNRVVLRKRTELDEVVVGATPAAIAAAERRDEVRRNA